MRWDGFFFCNNSECMLVMSGELQACDNRFKRQEMDKYPKE